MMLLVRNRVQDVLRWKRIFDAQTEAAREAGLNLINLWRSADQADQVFFLFDVQDRGRAEQYMSTPEAASVGREAGVIDGEFHFLEALTS
jgi:hypothetical protein